MKTIVMAITMGWIMMVLNSDDVIIGSLSKDDGNGNDAPENNDLIG